MTFHTTKIIRDLVKSNYLFHCLLKSRRNFFAFTFVIKNKVALVKQLPKANTTEIPAINSSTDFPLLYSLVFNNTPNNVENYSMWCEEKT